MVGLGLAVPVRCAWWAARSGGALTLALVSAVLATFGYAIAAVLTRAYVSGRMSNGWAATTQLAWGTVLPGPIAWASQGPPPSALPLGVTAALGALGLLGTGVAFLIYFTLLERVGAANTSMVTYLVPVVSLTSGALFAAGARTKRVSGSCGHDRRRVARPARAPAPGPSLSGPRAAPPASTLGGINARCVA